MTKLKSKKMTKSTFAVIIMAVLLVAMLAFGGTYAFFTATANSQATGEATTATLQISTGVEDSQMTNVTVNTAVLPGQKAIEGASIAVTNNSTVATYIFAKMTKEGDALELVIKTGDAENPTASIIVVELTTASAANWLPVPGYEDVYYLEAGANENTTAKVFAFDATFDSRVQSKNVETAEGTTAQETTNVYDKDDLNTTVDVMGVSISVNVEFGAIQKLKEGTTNYTPAEAYVAYLGQFNS